MSYVKCFFEAFVSRDGDVHIQEVLFPLRNAATLQAGYLVDDPSVVKLLDQRIACGAHQGRFDGLAKEKCQT